MPFRPHEDEANFDETNKGWVVDLKKEGRQPKTFLEPLDAGF
jgi:hypothetical protein